MPENKMISRVENDTVLVLERVFNAPRELVFKMFKEPEHLKHWWGPKGWELPVCNIEFRPGGVWHYCMKCFDRNQGEFYGMESWGKAVYKEIVEPAAPFAGERPSALTRLRKRGGRQVSCRKPSPSAS